MKLQLGMHLYLQGYHISIGYVQLSDTITNTLFQLKMAAYLASGMDCYRRTYTHMKPVIMIVSTVEW